MRITIIKKADYIIGHNILFDIFVLSSELYRIKYKNDFDVLQNCINNKKYFCTGEMGRNICKLPTKQKEYKYKMPKLEELYIKTCGSNKMQFHNAKNDLFNPYAFNNFF